LVGSSSGLVALKSSLSNLLLTWALTSRNKPLYFRVTLLLNALFEQVPNTITHHYKKGVRGNQGIPTATFLSSQQRHYDTIPII